MWLQLEKEQDLRLCDDGQAWPQRPPGVSRRLEKGGLETHHLPSWKLGLRADQQPLLEQLLVEVGGGGHCSGHAGPAERVGRQPLCTLEVGRSALENSACLGGPLPLLVPSVSPHLLTAACAETLFFVAKASSSHPSQGQRQKAGPKLDMERAALAWLSDRQARFS